MAVFYPLVSVIVNTTGNRETKLRMCLESIQANMYSPFEILVIQQSKKADNFRFPIRTYKIERKGAGYGKNVGIFFSKGEILLFTDDDCIVSKNWINAIVREMLNNPKVAAVFGRVLPYKKTEKNGFYCPSIVTRKIRQVFSTQVYHDQVGSGNNMAIRKDVLEKVGGFREWLGPGSIGANADDAEMIIRLLTNNNTILYSPKSVVFHNRWISLHELHIQNNEYIRGEAACYAFYALWGYSFAWKRLWYQLSLLSQRYRHSISRMIFRSHFQDWIIPCLFGASSFACGLIVGCFFYIKSLIFRHEKNNIIFRI